MDDIKNILFVCTMNKFRSPTAESLVLEASNYNVRSCGTDKWARHTVTEETLDWADIIFVMEREHKKVIQRDFDNIFWNDKIICLSIEDRFAIMDPELITILTNKLKDWIEI